MSNQVYANDMEVSCKQGAGKSICAFPDVCFTPPQTPATPPGVPIPYPNTGMDGDATDGSSTVKISGQEVMLKNKSSFKKSTGDEAGSAPKKGLISSSNKGKVYFVAWSMDVKVEGENVVRHLDMTTGNHACPNANEAVPWTYAQRMASGKIKECEGEEKKVHEKCSKKEVKSDADKAAFGKQKPYCPSTEKLDEAWSEAGKTRRRLQARMKGKRYRRAPSYNKRMRKVRAQTHELARRTKSSECQQALRCFLAPYSDPPPKPDAPHKLNTSCCPGQTGHHLIPAATARASCPGYDHNAAPVICVEGMNQHHGSHKKIHVATDQALQGLADANPPKVVKGKVGYSDLKSAVIDAAEDVFDAGCSRECLEKQLDNYYKGKANCSDSFSARDSQGNPVKRSSAGGVF